MSVKNQEHVKRYSSQVADIRAALANMLEFSETLPAVDEAGSLPTLDYGQITIVSAIHRHLGEISRIAGEMYQRG